MHRVPVGSGHLFLRQGDITTLAFGAIVNAANSRLAGGGGVDGAIHRAAGIVELRQACETIIAEIGSLPPGQAVLTSGFKLPAKHIIHTVGPVWRGGLDNEPALLRDAYLNSLRLGKEHDITTIAFSAISCGIYGYPLEAAARIALTALKEGLEAGLAVEAGMVLHDAAALEIWATAADQVL